MADLMNDRFKILCYFKGFGNPNGKLWFVGIEEAIGFETDFDNILESYSREYIPAERNSIKEKSEKYGRHYTKIYDVMAKIIVGQTSETDWKKYRNQSLLQAASNEFQMNLYPLGKKNTKIWNNFYQDTFGFKDKQDYVNYVQTNRFTQLYNYWQSNRPSFTICFGKGYKEDFKQALSLQKEIYIKESDLVLFPDDKVVLTPFFDNRNMGQERINQTIETIKQFSNF